MSLKSAIIKFFSKFILRINKLNNMNEWDMSDIFLISYPKSGTSWLSLILANILSENDKIKRRIDFFNVHDYIPDLHSNPQRIHQINPPRIIKSHESFKEFLCRVKLKGDQIRPRIIYLLRNGKDCMASYYKYTSSLNKNYDKSFAQFLNDNKNKRLNWDIHVKEWLIKNKHLDKREILIVTYEDLMKNTLSEINKILKFIGMKVEKKVILKSIKNSDIKKIRVYQKKYGDGSNYSDPNYNFTRLNKKRNITNQLKDDLEKYYKKNISIFKSLGY